MEEIIRQGYVVIEKELLQLKGNDKMAKILTYSLIKSWKKYNTDYQDIDTPLVSDITYKQVEQQLNMNIDKVIPDLINDGVFSQVHKTYKGVKERNIYTFKEETNYFYVDNAFFDNTTKENNKIKGFLLLLKCVCINGTNKYISKKPIKGKYNLSELISLIGLSKNTLKKYIDAAIKANWLQLIEGGLLITNPFIKPDRIKEDDNLTMIYDTIYNYCISKGCIPPKRENAALRLIDINYPTKEEDYLQYIANGIVCNTYLPLALEKRLNNLPKEVNWQYLITALTNNRKAMTKKVCHIILTM